MAMTERSLLEEVQRLHGGSVKAVGAELSLTSATMYRKLKALAVDTSVYKRAADSVDPGLYVGIDDQRGMDHRL